MISYMSEAKETVFTIVWVLMTFISLGVGFAFGWCYSNTKHYQEVQERLSAYNAKRRAKYAERKAKKHRETGVITL